MYVYIYSQVQSEVILIAIKEKKFIVKLLFSQ